VSGNVERGWVRIFSLASSSRAGAAGAACCCCCGGSVAAAAAAAVGCWLWCCCGCCCWLLLFLAAASFLAVASSLAAASSCLAASFLEGERLRVNGNKQKRSAQWMRRRIQKKVDIVFKRSSASSMGGRLGDDFAAVFPPGIVLSGFGPKRVTARRVQARKGEILTRSAPKGHLLTNPGGT